MLVSEQIESVDREELKQQNHIHKDTECSEETTIYGHVNQHMEKNISNTLHKIYDAFISYNESGRLSNDEAIENLAKRFQKSIKGAKENNCMFSIPCHIDIFSEGEKSSVIDSSIWILCHLMNKDKNVTEIGKSKLMLLWLEMSALVSTGTDVSKKIGNYCQ